MKHLMQDQMVAWNQLTQMVADQKYLNYLQYFTLKFYSKTLRNILFKVNKRVEICQTYSCRKNNHIQLLMSTHKYNF